MQFCDLNVGPPRRHRKLDIFELKIGGRQNLEIDAAADFDLGAGEVRKLRLDQVTLRAPVNEIRYRQSSGQKDDQNDGEDCEDFAQVFSPSSFAWARRGLRQQSLARFPTR